MTGQDIVEQVVADDPEWRRIEQESRALAAQEQKRARRFAEVEEANKAAHRAWLEAVAAARVAGELEPPRPEPRPVPSGAHAVVQARQRLDADRQRVIARHAPRIEEVALQLQADLIERAKPLVDELDDLAGALAAAAQAAELARRARSRRAEVGVDEGPFGAGHLVDAVQRGHRPIASTIPEPPPTRPMADPLDDYDRRTAERAAMRPPSSYDPVAVER